MAKKAPFFSHDMNARTDPKISAMRGVYGAQGYGWWWMLVEMMAESDGYQLDCKSRYVFNAYAMQLQCDADDIQRFVEDCIGEFELFESDGNYFWSNSLRKRMEYRDIVSEKRTQAANKRWEKQQTDANASKPDANAMQEHQKLMQNHANKTKQNNTLKHIVDSGECDRQFETFWKAYPKKNGKADAQKKWRSYDSKMQIDFDEVMQGLARYMKFIENEHKRGFDRQHMDGKTFVNQRQWESEWAIESNIKPFPTKKDDAITREEWEKREREAKERAAQRTAEI